MEINMGNFKEHQRYTECLGNYHSMQSGKKKSLITL